MHEILQVIAGGKYVALTDDYHGADCGLLACRDQGVGERAVHQSGDGVLFLRPIELDRQDAARARSQDIHGMWHLRYRLRIAQFFWRCKDYHGDRRDRQRLVALTQASSTMAVL